MLCFILDTPHRGRYFHDCVIKASKRKVQASPVGNPHYTPSVEPERSTRCQRLSRPLKSQVETGTAEKLSRKGKAVRKTGQYAPSPGTVIAVEARNGKT
jgi:hypothetical protein